MRWVSSRRSVRQQLRRLGSFWPAARTTSDLAQPDRHADEPALPPHRPPGYCRPGRYADDRLFATLSVVTASPKPSRPALVTVVNADPLRGHLEPLGEKSYLRLAVRETRCQSRSATEM
jgi:hypothetical protein